MDYPFFLFVAIYALSAGNAVPFMGYRQSKPRHPKSVWKTLWGPGTLPEKLGAPMGFDISEFTTAGLKMKAQIRYEGNTAERVFDVLGNPELIPQWYLLAKEVHIQEARPGEEPPFTVEFTFFGLVDEEILHWDPPRRYVYLAKGAGFPIKDYVACIEVEETDSTSGIMSWHIYCDEIEGEHFQKILPVMLPAINEASMNKLSPLIGGVECTVESYFDV